MIGVVKKTNTGAMKFQMCVMNDMVKIAKIMRCVQSQRKLEFE